MTIILRFLLFLVKLVPKTDSSHKCGCLSPIRKTVHPVKLQNNSYVLDSNNVDEKRQEFETYVFVKLEEYSTKKSMSILHSTSLSHMRRRLKRDVKGFLKECDPNVVSEDTLYRWIDEIIDQIQSHISQLRLLHQTHGDLEDLLNRKNIFLSNAFNNHWKEMQLKQAKKVLKSNLPETDEEIILLYEEYVVEKLTPKQLQDNKIPFRNNEKIDLDKEYKKAEEFGREYLTEILNNYKERRRPNLKLIQEIIRIGMQQMIKRPKNHELHQASTSSNILDKLKFVLKSKRSYLMSLQNLADDFMVSINFF